MIRMTFTGNYIAVATLKHWNPDLVFWVDMQKGVVLLVRVTERDLFYQVNYSRTCSNRVPLRQEEGSNLV